MSASIYIMFQTNIRILHLCCSNNTYIPYWCVILFKGVFILTTKSRKVVQYGYEATCT